MKKIVVVLALLAVVLTPVMALARWDQSHILMKEYTTQAELTDYSLTSGSAIYSSTIDTQHNAQYSTLLITENKAGGAGDVDVSVEYSIDGTNWYSAYRHATVDSSGFVGPIMKDGDVVTGLQNSTRWIVYTPRAGRYVRYKFDPDADSKITATHIFINSE